MKKLLTQQIQVGGQPIEGPLEGINNVGDLVNKVINFLIPLAGIILLLIFIWGGYDFMMSQGQPDKVKSAQAKITTGVIGFVLLILAFIITKILAFIFGLNTGGLFQ
mgnify:CR=1 FL=1